MTIIFGHIEGRICDFPFFFIFFSVFWFPRLWTDERFDRHTCILIGMSLSRPRAFYLRSKAPGKKAKLTFWLRISARITVRAPSTNVLIRRLGDPYRTVRLAVSFSFFAERKMERQGMGRKTGRCPCSVLVRNLIRNDSTVDTVPCFFNEEPAFQKWSWNLKESAVFDLLTGAGNCAKSLENCYLKWAFKRADVFRRPCDVGPIQRSAESEK